MIDLSFLTEEEQEAIMKVLQRDAELKRTEEERVRHLPEKVKDHVQLKNMSGQWFYEAKSKRHRDRIHGADIIRASMRRKTATIAEVGQNKTSKAKISWVNNVNKEVFEPSDLHCIEEHQEEEQQKTSWSSKEVTSVLNKSEERPVKAAVSSVRQRRNPFNSTVSDDDLTSVESEDRPVIVPQLSKKEIWSLSENSPPKSNLQNHETDKPEKPSVELTDESQKQLVKRPVPKARKLIHKAADSVSQREDLVPKPTKQTERVNGIGTPPRGILKRSSSSSSTDSEVRVSQTLDVQKKNGLATATIFEGEGEKNSFTEEAENSTQNSLEKLKQVRFSSSSGKGKPVQSPQLHHDKEKGENDILEAEKKKNGGNYAVQSDSFGDKQIPAAKPLGIYSSTLKMKTIDGLQEDTSASSPCDSNRSYFPVNESFQTDTVSPKKLETPQKTSSNILSNSNNERSVDKTHEKKSNQILSHESESHKNFTDGHQLSAETEAREASNTNSTSLQQGKPDLVEDRDAKTIFKPGKHADELMKVDDESVAKVLDWFKRSSSTEDEEVVSTKSQGREPREEVDVSIRSAVLPTEHSGPGMHGKTEHTEERPFGKTEQQSRISSTSFTSENIQLIKERAKPKTGEANEKQNDKLLNEFDCTRVEEKEHDQEIKQQNIKSNLLDHQGHKLLAQKFESEKAIQEKRRIKEIRAFWERDKTIPSHGEKEVSINADASGGCAFTGLRESDQLKRTAVYLPEALHDQSKNTPRSPELSCASQASRSKSYHSFESGPGHAFGKPEVTLQCDELPKASNLHPRTSVTSASSKSKDEDEKETLKGKVAASSQQKPSFQVLSLKEKMNEKSKNQILDPSHFQSLRNFWDTGVKFQSSIDREDDSLPNNTRSITYVRKSKEDKKGRDNVSKQGLIQQQTQTSEREKPQKLDSVVCKKSLRSPILKGLNVTHTRNTDSLQLDRQPSISKSQEKMGLPEQEVRECTEKSIVSSKDHHVSLQLHSPGDKDALKDPVVDDKLYLPIEKGENKTTPLDKEEVAETVDKVVLPKGELDIFKSCLKKLEKEASEMSCSLNLKENLLKGTHFQSNQCKVFERTGDSSHDISPVDQGEEIGKSTGQVIVSSTDKHENRNSLRKLFREFEPLYLQYQAADKDDTLEGSQRPQAGLENLLNETLVPQPSEYRRVEIKTYDDSNSLSQTNCSAQSAHQEGTGQPEEVHEPIEKSVAGSKVNGLSSALEKLLKEASEAPPPKSKRVDSTAWETAEEQVERIMYEHGGEVLQEISETIERSVAPSKASGLSSALERLLKEASETPPPKPKRADSTAQRTAEVQVKSTTYESDGELLQEIHEIIEKSVASSSDSNLSSALEKLLKEASETPPPKPKHADSAVQRFLKVEAESMTYKHGGEVPQEISANIAPSKASGLSSALERMLKEASETPSPKPKRADSTVQGTAEVKAMSTSYGHDGELVQGVGETTERPALSNTEYRGSDNNFQNPPKEVSEIPASVLENMDKKMHAKIQTSVSIHVPHQQDRDHPQEIQETIEKTSVSNITKFGEFSRSLEKLLQEASAVSCPISKDLYQQEEFEDHTFPSEKETLLMTSSHPYNTPSSYDTQMKIVLKEGAPEKYVKASVNDLGISKIEAYGLKIDEATNKMGERNMVPVDLRPLEGKTNMVEVKPFEINAKGMNESTFLEASEQNSEFQALMNFRRTSTPLKDESNSPQPEEAQFCLMSQHEDNNEDKGNNLNLGSRFSDDNSDSYSETGSTARSEEELNPVLMALKRSADRKKPSKSLEDIPSVTSNKEKLNKPKEELVLSAEDVSTVTSQPDKPFSNPEKLKGLSKSVPSFLQEESDDRETDTTSESSYSFGRIKKSPSSLTNLSSSSGMASLSSVSGSLMSIYSADFGNVDVKGNIQFAIDYVEQLDELHIFICQCKDLAVADVKRQRSDPYVKTYLLPEKYRLGKRKTSIKKKTFNPVYNEILRYKIEKELLKNQSLNISVWHNDTFGRNSFLGEVELDLGAWDWNDPSSKQINWFPLKPRTSAITLNLENRGEMKLALQYVPHPVGGKKTLSTGEVHIWVKECHNLPLLRGNRLNSFIKCTILPDTSRKSRQKTRTVTKTTNPVFNHTMVYDGFRPEDLKEACIELTVWDHNKLANHFLGGLRIGLGTGKSYGTTVDWMDSTSDETALWEKMMNSPNTWIEDTLPLRMLMVAKLTK
ncbi:synaptotagmin-like protein 2 isoform X3 [Haemorhous mexicanus]|uniref:synaptotagmin-like protein 2 isoform X3 n=1 Tax=Haemorhous mexicanus TaxID=30427 RepID=UPI0028BE5A2D|nr:synaptotagmin-like protein 2 isoform X3 [Haemorhous mexicanus]